VKEGVPPHGRVGPAAGDGGAADDGGAAHPTETGGFRGTRGRGDYRPLDPRRKPVRTQVRALFGPVSG
jgi:hypothetical protein